MYHKSTKLDDSKTFVTHMTTQYYYHYFCKHNQYLLSSREPLQTTNLQTIYETSNSYKMLIKLFILIILVHISMAIVVFIYQP